MIKGFFCPLHFSIAVGSRLTKNTRSNQMVVVETLLERVDSTLGHWPLDDERDEGATPIKSNGTIIFCFPKNAHWFVFLQLLREVHSAANN